MPMKAPYLRPSLAMRAMARRAGSKPLAWTGTYRCASSQIDEQFQLALRSHGQFEGHARQNGGDRVHHLDRHAGQLHDGLALLAAGQVEQAGDDMFGNVGNRAVAEHESVARIVGMGRDPRAQGPHCDERSKRDSSWPASSSST